MPVPKTVKHTPIEHLTDRNTITKNITDTIGSLSGDDWRKDYGVLRKKGIGTSTAFSIIN